MKVKKRMAKKLVTTRKEATVADAINLMKKHSIRHLPVVEDGELLGWVTERDIREAYLASLIEQVSIGDIMIKDPITIAPEANLEEAAELLYRHGIGGLPVVDKGKLVGVITVADIMAAFIEVMGILQESSRIDVIFGGKLHAFENVSKIIRDQESEIISVGMSAQQDRTRRIYYLRLTKCDVHALAKEIEKAGYKVVSMTE
ncbi:MAG: CBS domain-containing protein [Deltaproteobacteria bacterium]|jgi:acetoin utilization protein AcuB|nr:CBS domain-containing protein [Deltaproteobacteria bacterium]